MSALLDSIVDLPTVELPPWLHRLVSAGLSEQDGCVFLAALAPPVGTHAPEQVQDLTGWEAFVNHFHIDLIDDSFADVALALSASNGLIDHIERSGFEFPVRVIVGRNLDGEFRNSTVRLHRVRPYETWLSADLEGYGREAVAYFDTRPKP